jgi:hypothetical protein
MKVKAMTQSAPGPVSLQLVFARLGAECTDLAGLAERLQAVLAPAMLGLADDADCHRHAQSLDLFAQRLAGIATILETLRGQVPSAWQTDVEAALRDVTLSELATRLRGGAAAMAPCDAGVLELF